MTRNIPFANAYWVLPARFLAGPFPGDYGWSLSAESIKRLAESGIRCVINLMEEDEIDLFGKPFEPYLEILRKYAGEGAVIRWKRMPIRDMDIPTKQVMKKILDEIDIAIREGLPVYLHCLGGIGRTGTVVGCYLARHGIALGEDALEMIAQLRRENENADIPSPQTEVQRNFVRIWQRGE